MLALVNTPNGKAPVELRQIRRRRVVGDGVARSGREWRGGGVRQFLRRDDKHQLCRFPRRAKCALAELLLVHFGAGGAVCAGSCIAGVALVADKSLTPQTGPERNWRDIARVADELRDRRVGGKAVFRVEP